jgi:hypothetical protein
MLKSARPALAVLVFLILLSTPLLADSQIFYLKGDPADQTNKVVNDVGSATFDQAAPTGTIPITQTTTAFANEDFVANGLALYWSGPYSGPATGTLDFKWYWSSQVASAIGGFLDISIFADPDYASANRVQPEKLIGRALVPLSGIGATPTLVHSQIPISGNVVSTLLIQCVPHYLANDSELFVHYNSASTPSSFQILSMARVPFPAAPQSSGLPLRFKTLTPSPAQLASGLGTDAGEPSIGANWISKNALFLSLNTTFRVKFDDSCPVTPSATWTNKSALGTSVISLDPILFTDPETGRTQVSELLANPLVSASAFSDDDGESWTPSQGAGIGSGVDHQTIGGGPFHAPIPTGTAYSHAVYYCSQDIAEAGCAVSLDGGLTFGPAVPIYAGQCGGLHGHIKVAPDGTAYVPNKGCGENEALVVSEDNGMTWTIRKVPNSLPADSDPSIGISKAGANSRGGRVYFAFADNNNDPVVAVSDDKGQTWHNVYNVAPGIHNVAFPAMVAGDDDRAAFAFLGTSATGSLQARSFPGAWHLYVASTFDGGKTWSTSDATPNDPVQRGPIWMAGGAEISRNLLDFMDATIDQDGRVLIGFADGCFAACTQAPDAARGNSYSAIASIARQSGGRRMFAAKDPAEPTLPGAPTLTITRNGAIARLTWSEANDGGSPVTGYSVYRNGARIGTTSATSYADTSADPNTTYTWSVTATNALGSSCGSNAVAAAPSGSSCDINGLSVVTDPAGDQTGAPQNAALDIQSVAIAEPYTADGAQKLVFIIKTGSLASLPASSQWRVIWNFPVGDSGQYYAEMHTDSNGAVGFEYGRVDITGAVVTSVGQPTALGAAEADSGYTPDGTIRIVLLKNKLTATTTDPGPQTGDLVGGLIARTYTAAGSLATSGRAAIDSTRIADVYALVGNSYCGSATTCLDDDDARIAYANGWHLVDDADASGGHFRLGTGNPSASLTFTVPANQFGAVTYWYAKSTKGGSAELFVDGVSQGTISYNGTSGSLRAPQFGFSQRIAGLQPGTHTLEIRAKGAAYLDRICLESSGSNATPAAGPGATSSSSSTLGVAQDLVSQLTIPSNATAISVVAEAPALVKIVLIDPTGLALATADTSSGLAVINQPLSRGGVYLLKATNLSVGPVSVWTAATPLVGR